MDSQTSATTPAAVSPSPSQPAGAGAPPGTSASAAGPSAPGQSPVPARGEGAAAAGQTAPSAAGQSAPNAEGQPAASAAEPTPAGAEAPRAGFGSRGRLRRRARFLRKARELAYRDLGGLVFSLHRFGQRNDSLVLAKLATLGRIDAELRAIEDSLSERQPLTVLREAGITACPRCAAIHSSEDRFCPSCGLAMSRHSDLPIAGAPAGGAAQPAAQPATPPAAPAVPASPPRAPATPTTVGPGAGVPAPSSASPVPAPSAPLATPVPTPATQAFDAVQAPGQSQGHAPPPAGRGEDDQPTEIIRPPAPGS